MSENSNDMARTKVQKIFTYIRELTKLRTPPLSQTDSYEWKIRFSKLPKYPTIKTFDILDDTSEEFDGVILRIRRPVETPCPPPPLSISEWVESGWEQINGSSTYIPARNIKDKNEQTVTERFEDDPTRKSVFQVWIQKCNEWRAAEIPVRIAGSVFSDFFKLHGQLQRESEKYQLYIGDGNLVWESAIEAVDHPILLKKLELEFDSAVPEFILRETEDSSELYTALLRHHELDGNAILASKKHLDETDAHPLGKGKTEEFFKFFIQRSFPNGKFSESREPSEGACPKIFRDPIIFLGSRSQGFADALDKLIDSLPAAEVISEALLRIVGVDEKQQPEYSNSASESISTFDSNFESDFLLTKPANREQERVISRLEQTGSVLVQGPPGTGKSHTIANIVGHLLASGKTVLISSHTSKALRVVREKVAKSLQPLCVSVLDKDAESKSQLEESINGIISYLSRTDSQSLTIEISQLAIRRSEIKVRLDKLETQALEIRKGEYSDIIVAGESTAPSHASRKVAELESQHGWIPGPLEPSAPLPLSETELQEVYSTNIALPIDIERSWSEGIPDLSKILKPSEFKEIQETWQKLDEDKSLFLAEYWHHSEQEIHSIDKISRNLEKSLEIFSGHKWLQKVVEDSKLGAERLAPWRALVQLIDSTTNAVGKRSELILQFGPKCTFENTSEGVEICREIIEHLRAGKSLGFFNTAFRGSWKAFISVSSVDDDIALKKEHYESVLALLETRQLRKEFLGRWERQVEALGGPKLQNLEPELQAKTLVEALDLAMNWTTDSWRPIESELNNQGFNLQATFEKVSLTDKSVSSIEHIQKAAESIIVPALKSRREWIRIRELAAMKEKTLHILRLNSQKLYNGKTYLRLLESSVQSPDVDGYETAYNNYLDICGKQEVYNRRLYLINKLKRSAPGWAKAIELRTAMHGEASGPEQSDLAWRICQWRQELDRRISEDYSAVQDEIKRLKLELQGINGQYVEKLAWKFQFSRTGLREKQALSGWQQMQNKITKSGKGVRDAQMKRAARNTLKECKNAVPVWIMPLSKVYDSFDLTHSKFDVIILDEASQSDITALAAFAIAKQVIVVGDSEQVTPYSVGLELKKIQSLIDELLQGIPNKELYDGKTSVYDLAAQAFGETIRLVEHFRCVPDIIEFSNQLSYNGEIKPLREASSSPYANHVVAHRTGGQSLKNNTNMIEAVEVASIISAMSEMKEYESVSIGVVSMVGQEQAILIDSILQRRLPPTTYSSHKILCGNASQFQGDERDVMLLSVVHSCESPPLNMLQKDDVQKTFNVAASRARNQLWVVHSLNTQTDLKPGDLRLRLIQHAENPKALKASIEATQKKADPKSVVFEPMVIKDLMQAGYRVTPQYEVGAYTIDMVIEGDGKRIALECDGDRYHPPEKLVDDIQRQLVLERLGWTFIRVRGTEYFRHRSATVLRILNQLEAMGIEKLGPINSQPISEKNDELKDRLLRRAFEIRLEWETTAETEQEMKPKRKRRSASLED